MDMVLTGILIPFFAAVLGSLAAVLMRRKSSRTMQRGWIGFASGVMIALSIWSLILPAMKISEELTSSSFIPAVPGYWLGILFMLGIDQTVPHLHLHADTPEGRRSSLSKPMMRVLSAVIHNIPEGMAVGAVLAAFQDGAASRSTALALAAGIAVQNIPESAILSIPFAEEGVSKSRSVFLGVLSGTAEPIAAVLTLWLARNAGGSLPVLLSAAAGAMMYVVVEELIPAMSSGEHSNLGTIAFALGFSLMMVFGIVSA